LCQYPQSLHGRRQGLSETTQAGGGDEIKQGRKFPVRLVGTGLFRQRQGLG
jgi:hypothetical protein